MNGRIEKENKVINKIESLINTQTDKDYLKGFFFYISSMSVNSCYNYIIYVINFMNFINKTPEKLTTNDYSSYMFFIRNKTSSYRIAVYSALKKFSSYLQANEINNKNPMQYIERPKATESQATKVKRENGYLNKEELKIYLNNVENNIYKDRKKNKTNLIWVSRDFLIVLLFLNTGMRCSALAQINIEDINFSTKELTVYEKEDKIITYVLSDSLIEKINIWLNNRKTITSDNTGALFISSFRKRVSERTLYAIINKYGFNIEGKKLSPHKLRATYGTQLYDATKDIVFVQKAMNHNSSHTTELYIRGKEDTARKQASDIMAKLTFE